MPLSRVGGFPMRTRFFLSVLFFFLCLSALSYAQSAAVGDLNGDGKPDLVAGNISPNTVTIFINNGAGTLTATHFLAVSVPAPSLMKIVRVFELKFPTTTSGLPSPLRSPTAALWA